MAARTDGRSRVWGILWSSAAGLVLVGCGGSKSTGELIDLTRSKDSADRARAIRGLGEREAEADVVVPVLARALKDEDAFVRRDAARGLGRFGPAASPAVPDLRSAVRDKNQHVRQAASDALRQIAPNLPPEPSKR